MSLLSSFLFRVGVGLALPLTVLLPTSAAAAPSAAPAGRPLIVDFVEQLPVRMPSPVFSVVQTGDGSVHVAFPELRRLLSYDGGHWRETSLPCSPLSLAAAGTRVWVGCDGDLGRLETSGAAAWVSLSSSLPSRPPEGLAPHAVLALDHGALFVDRRSLVQVADGGEARVFGNPVSEPFAAVASLRGLPVVVRGGELMVLEDSGLRSLWRVDEGEITALTAWHGGLLAAVRIGDRTRYWLVSADGSARRWGTGHDDDRYRAELLTPLSDGGLAVATANRGVVVLATDGRLRSVHDRESGFRGGPIRALMVDRLGSLWVGHGTGLSRISLSWPISFFGAPEGLDAPVTWVRRHRGELVVGTVAGVHRLEAVGSRRGVFRPFAGLESLSAWDSELWGEELWLATDDGIWRLGATRDVEPELMLAGAHWALAPLDDARLLAFRPDDRRLVSLRLGAAGLEPISELAVPADIYAIVVESERRAWLWSSKQKLFFVAFEPDGVLRSVRPVLPEATWRDLVEIRGRLRLSTDDATWVPHPSLPGNLVRDPEIDLDILGAMGDESGSFGLLEDARGDTWITTYSGIRRLAEPTAMARPFAVAATTEPYFDPEQEGTLWVGHDGGLVRVDLTRPLPIGHLEASGTLVLRSFADEPRSRRFEFAVPHYFDESTLSYQYRLVGLEDEWTEWTSVTSTSYPRLAPGLYRFEVRARQLGNPLGSAWLDVRISPPWFLTPWAFALFALSVVVLPVLIWQWHSTQLRRRNRQLWRTVTRQTQFIRERREEAERQAREVAQTNRQLHRALEATAREQRARREMEARVQQLDRLESLGRLTAGVAHDFNNHLMAILGHAQLALTREELDSDLREGLGVIESTALKAGDLCQQMMTFTGRCPVRIRRSNPAQLIDTARSLVEAAAGRHHRLVFELEEDVADILVDPAGFQQILISLVVNSAEALADSHGSITVRCGRRRLSRSELARLRFAKELRAGEYDYLEVEDDGPGMAPEVRRRLFEPFFSTKFLGRGLGLAAVFGVVQSHGGAVELDSEVGRGTRLRIYFPSVAVEEPVRRTRVLVVDDESHVLETAERMLDVAGYRATTAIDGQEALEQFDRHRQELGAIVLDIAMPEEDGLEVLRRLRGRDSAVPVVVSTGFEEQEIRARASGLRIDAFLPKPYGFSDLVAVLDRVVSGGAGSVPPAVDRDEETQAAPSFSQSASGASVAIASPPSEPT